MKDMQHNFERQCSTMQAEFERQTLSMNSELAFLRDQLANKPLNHNHQTNPPNQYRTPKIILSSFDGTNPLDWVFQAEQYFELHQISKTQWLSYAAFYMQGPTLGWYKWLHSNKQLTTWAAFTQALEVRFGPSSYANHQASLFKLRQTGTVMDYQL